MLGFRARRQATERTPSIRGDEVGACDLSAGTGVIARPGQVGADLAEVAESVQAVELGT